MPAKLAIAHDSMFGMVNDRRHPFISHRRRRVSAAVAATPVVPVGSNPQDVIEMFFIAYAASKAKVSVSSP
jgi:hypothetical protein